MMQRPDSRLTNTASPARCPTDHAERPVLSPRQRGSCDEPVALAPWALGACEWFQPRASKRTCGPVALAPWALGGCEWFQPLVSLLDDSSSAPWAGHQLASSLPSGLTPDQHRLPSSLSHGSRRAASALPPPTRALRAAADRVTLTPWYSETGIPTARSIRTMRRRSTPTTARGTSARTLMRMGMSIPTTRRSSPPRTTRPRRAGGGSCRPRMSATARGTPATSTRASATTSPRRRSRTSETASSTSGWGGGHGGIRWGMWMG